MAADFAPALGLKVLVSGVKGLPAEAATIRYMGTTDFAEGEWFGVELDAPRGKNDGTVKGRKYFDCQENHGLFVRENMIEPLTDGAGGEKPAKARRASTASRKSAQPKRASVASSPGGASQVSTSAASATSPSSPGSPTTSPAKKSGGFSYEMRKKQLEDLQQVRAAVRALATTVRRVEEKAVAMEKTVEEREAGLDASLLCAARAAVEAQAEHGASTTEQAFMQKWLKGLGDHLTRHMGQEIQSQAKAAISNAVAEGTKDLAQATQQLQQSNIGAQPQPPRDSE